jgi:CBS domain-containing protein
MNAAICTPTVDRTLLLNKTAEDLMTVNPVSVRENATIREAIAFLTATGFSGAPVVNEAGRPVGVVSKTDLLRHVIAGAAQPAGIHAGHDGAALMCDPEAGRHGPFCNGPAEVREVMTPAVVAVPRTASLAQVAGKMIGRGVNRVFVIDKTGALVGVISSLDVLRRLCP